MKASELRSIVEAVAKSSYEKGEIQNHITREDPFYDAVREKAMADYLNDVGDISKYINENMAKLAKEHDGMSK